MLLFRCHTSHATAWVLYIAMAARDQMNVHMGNGLTCILPVIHTYTAETEHSSHLDRARFISRLPIEPGRVLNKRPIFASCLGSHRDR